MRRSLGALFSVLALVAVFSVPADAHEPATFKLCTPARHPTPHCAEGHRYALADRAVSIRVRISGHNGSRIRLVRQAPWQGHYHEWARPLVVNGEARVRWVPRETGDFHFLAVIHRGAQLTYSNELWMEIQVSFD